MNKSLLIKDKKKVLFQQTRNVDLWTSQVSLLLRRNLAQVTLKHPKKSFDSATVR